MKKIITTVLTSAMLCLSTSDVCAAVKSGALWYFLADSTAMVCIAGEGQYSGAVVVPASIEVEGKTYTVTGIGERAFYSSTAVTSVSLPATIDTIGPYAFCACYGLESINLEDTKVRSLPTAVFGACWGLKSMTLPSSLVKMTDNPFYMPKTLQSFHVAEGNPAYKAVDGILYSITGKTLIAYPFGKTRNVVVPEGTDSIGTEAFMNFREMRTCRLPESVTYIGRSCFSMCDTLESINLPRTITYIGGSAFHGNARMKGKAVFDDGLVSLGSSAFNSTGITEIEIPGSCTVIQKNAFYNCRGVTSIKLHEGIKRIMESAFCNCKAAEIVIPNSVTKLGSAVFSGNYTATRLVIGRGISEFEATPFENCSGLASVTCKGAVPPVYYTAYARRTPLFPSNVYTSAKLYVPAGSVDAYKDATGFSEFTDVTVGVETAGADDFNVARTPGGLEITGAEWVEVYTAAGVRTYAGAAGYIALPAGMYIVRVGNRTVKIMR